MSALSRPERQLAERYLAARRDRTLAVLEGFHAIKHSLRFGAALLHVAASDPAELERLATSLAPDLSGRFEQLVELVTPAALGSFGPSAPRTGVMAIARRPHSDVDALLACAEPSPVVFLEDTRNPFNIGACVRVAAAADVAGVLTTSMHDPWHPDALRGAAGLHFALPVLGLRQLPRSDRQLIALAPEGEPLNAAALSPRALLAFGTERDGLSDALLERADARVALPMRAGVSSLNLATSVAAVLYSWRLAASASHPEGTD
ncbi:MAG TPA: TrmH family RNA methyltransferase [Thermoleophilaceae bacterium]